MSDPAWMRSAYYSGGAAYSFPSPQVFAASLNGAAFQINCPTDIVGKVYLEMFQVAYGGATEYFGIVGGGYTGPDVSDNSSLTAYYNSTSSGCIFVNGSAASPGGLGYPGTTAPIRMCLDTVAKLLWIAVDNTTAWNGSYSDAQVAAGTGGIDISSLPLPWIVFACTKLGGGSTFSAEIAASVANCKYVPPSGFAYAPANAALEISSVTIVNGTDGKFIWDDANGIGVAALDFDLITAGISGAAGGTVSGISGTATLPGTGTLATGYYDNVLIYDPAIPQNTSPEHLFIVNSKPAGSGKFLTAFQDKIIVGQAGGYSKLFAFDFPGQFIFDFSFTTPGGSGMSGNGTFRFQQGASPGSGASVIEFGFVCNNDPPTMNGPGTPTSGPVSNTFVRTCSAQGTFTTSVATNLNYSLDFENNGTLSTYLNRSSGGPGPLDHLAVSEFSFFTAQTQIYSLAIFEAESDDLLNVQTGM